MRGRQDASRQLSETLEIPWRVEAVRMSCNALIDKQYVNACVKRIRKVNVPCPSLNGARFCLQFTYLFQALVKHDPITVDQFCLQVTLDVYTSFFLQRTKSHQPSFSADNANIVRAQEHYRCCRAHSLASWLRCQSHETGAFRCSHWLHACPESKSRLHQKHHPYTREAPYFTPVPSFTLQEVGALFLEYAQRGGLMYVEV